MIWKKKILLHSQLFNKFETVSKNFKGKRQPGAGGHAYNPSYLGG
jgi:hypothetical protein